MACAPSQFVIVFLAHAGVDQAPGGPRWRSSFHQRVAARLLRGWADPTAPSCADAGDPRDCPSTASTPPSWCRSRASREWRLAARGGARSRAPGRLRDPLAIPPAPRALYRRMGRLARARSCGPWSRNRRSPQSPRRRLRGHSSWLQRHRYHRSQSLRDSEFPLLPGHEGKGLRRSLRKTKSAMPQASVAARGTARFAISAFCHLEHGLSFGLPVIFNPGKAKGP